MNTTRDAIIDEGLSQAVVFGLDGISIGGLASSLNLSKSGLFAHFKSKEALQLAVLDEAIERFARQVVAPALKAATPIQKLDRLFLGYLDWIRGDRQTGGCLFITAIQEFDERPGPVRDRLVASQMAWRATLEGAAREAIAAGGKPEPGPNVFVFELIGIALAYQHSQKLFRDKRARARREAFAHLKA